MTPKQFFHRVALAEAFTWAGLLVGMFLKYVTTTTEVGVSIFGMLHGVVFIAFCLVAIATWINQRWSIGVGLLALLSAVPPFGTVLFDWRAARAGLLDGPWRFGHGGETPRTVPERALAWLTQHPTRAAAVGVIAVAALTIAALAIGPPAGKG